VIRYAVILCCLCSVSFAQTVTLPPGSAGATGVKLTWTLPITCTTSNPCTERPYRILGVCPSPLTGTSGWTVLTDSASQATTVTDSTITSGLQYSYVVETQQGGLNSGPSNCISVTVPNVPSPATGLAGVTQ